MPSHKIHISIAQELNKELNVDSDLLMIGSILPDLCGNIDNHGKSHFKTKPDDHTFYNKELLLKKYNLDNPVILGYLIHLLTDEYYNKYVRENYFIIKEGKLCGIRGLNEIIEGSPIEITDIKQEEFTMYDKYLMVNKNLIQFDKFNIIYDLPIIEECNYDLNYVLKYMGDYNNEINQYSNIDYIYIKYKILGQQELDKLYINCIDYIRKYLSNLLVKI